LVIAIPLVCCRTVASTNAGIDLHRRSAEAAESHTRCPSRRRAVVSLESASTQMKTRRRRCTQSGQRGRQSGVDGEPDVLGVSV
jgi:hypothetical protein